MTGCECRSRFLASGKIVSTYFVESRYIYLATSASRVILVVKTAAGRHMSSSGLDAVHIVVGDIVIAGVVIVVKGIVSLALRRCITGLGAGHWVGGLAVRSCRG
jgi:hypothetical protein